MLGDMLDLMEIFGWGLFGVFVTSFILYLIPFVGPSTMICAGAMAAIHPDISPALIGVTVAVAASLSKAVHYYVSYFAGGALSEERISKLHRYCEKMGRWKSFVAFIAAATPVPDEPVLVWLGLVRYSPVRFLLAFLIGKLVITIPGAYVGRSAGRLLQHMFGNITVTVASIVFTVIVTIVLLKVDLGGLWRMLTRRKDGEKNPSKESP
jgi:membrane protein DedA with SNARE-associated domain